MMKYLAPLLILTLAACGSDDDASKVASAPANNENSSNSASPDAGMEPDSAEETRSDSVCVYTNPFSRGPECREYIGTWTADGIASDCAVQMGEVQVGECATEELIGRCEIPSEEFGESVLFSYGDGEGCRFAKLGCETFAKGTFEPTDACEDGGGEPPMLDVFLPPELICVDPIDGEPAGNGPNGQVCTWQLISGATEEGRHFEDYASCDVVRTQRPYYEYPRPDDAQKEDPRLEDENYVEDLNWVKSQIRSSACVCCHSSELTPAGVSNWDVDQPEGNFMNGFFDKGLALGANWVNSEALGAFPAEDNNGFDRVISGFPSTDPERMRDFFIAELTHRGRTQADFAEVPPFGGPLYDQIYFEPSECVAGQGISADGTLTWTGGDARYIYVLAEDSNSPTIPPNLDKPEGTIWRVDLSPESDPVASGDVSFGVVPEGATQVIPESGTPTFEAGTTYYLYVAADVAIPITRCLTTP